MTRLWDHQLIWFRKSERDDPDDSGEGATLFISADTEPGDTRNGEGKVIIAGLFKMSHIAVVCEMINFFYKGMAGIWHHALFTVHVHHAVCLVSERASCDDEEIGCIFFCDLF